MSKLQEKIDKYAEELKSIHVQPDMDLLAKVTKGCGPGIYKADAEKVSSGDKSELETVKQSFLIKKMGQPDSAKLDAAISGAINKIGPSNPNKYRAVFYYLLVKDLGLESKY